MTITVGHFLIAVALLDLILVPLVVRSSQRAKPARPVEAQAGISPIVMATIVMSIALVLAALFLPFAQIPILDLSE